MANLTLWLKNTGKGSVKDIDVTLNFEDSKISTIGSGTTKRVSRLGPGQTSAVNYQVIVDGSAEITVVDIPINLQFRDALNTEFNTMTNLGMIIKTTPELGIRLDDTTITKRNTVGDVSIQVVNSGIVDVGYVNLYLDVSTDYEILSYASDVYIGNLDSDDFEIADFRIKPLVANPLLQFRLSYKDPYNTDYDQLHTLPLRIISAKDLGQQQSSAWTIVLVLLVIGAGVWYYRKRKKQHKPMIPSLNLHKKKKR